MSKKNDLAFGKINYLITLAGILLLVIGFVVMASETAKYGFGPLGLTVGPIIVLIGFVTNFIAILYKPRK